MYLLSLKSEEKNELCYANERQNEKKTEEDEIALKFKEVPTWKNQLKNR